MIYDVYELEARCDCSCQCTRMQRLAADADDVLADLREDRWLVLEMMGLVKSEIITICPRCANHLNNHTYGH